MHVSKYTINLSEWKDNNLATQSTEFYEIRIPNILQVCFYIELAIKNKKDYKIECWKYLLFNIQICHKYYCAAKWLRSANIF